MSGPARPRPHLPSLPPAGDLPRTLYLLRMLWLCFFPVATVLLGNAVLLAVPQAREALLAQQQGFTLQDVGLSLAHIYWLGMAWYTARLLVDRRFSPDTTGLSVNPHFTRAVRVWLPRLLVLLGGLPMAVLFIATEALRGLGLALAALTLLFFRFVVMRRAWIEAIRRTAMPLRHLLPPDPPTRTAIDGSDERARETSGYTGLALALWFTVSFGLFIGLDRAMAPLARALGSPTLVLTALASWTLFGGIVLTYWPKSRGHPAMTWLPVLLFLVFSPLNENHPVAPNDGAPTNPAPHLAVTRLFPAWLAARTDPAAPVWLVASAGGASRAAYWATSSLGLLQDESRAGPRPFADNLFLISGTSGGALGAATFVATLAATGRDEATVREAGNAFTGRDHLSTLVGYLLYPDLVQRFLPFAVRRWDRSRALEEVWSRDWDDLHPPAANAGADGNPWRGAFTALHARSTTSRPLPLLALNTTALGQGQRVFQSDFALPDSDGIDLLAMPGLDVGRLTLAQAVHNSARFPYLSPGGMVRIADSGAVWDRLGDGGYVEASASLTVLEVVRALKDARLVRDCRRQPDDCKPGQGRRGRDWIDQSELRLVLLDNAPVDEGGWHCHDAPRGTDAPAMLNPPLDPHPMPLPDLLAPPLGLLQGRVARGATATRELIASIGGCAQVAELHLPRAPDHPEPSMNWMLNASSRRQIDAALDGRPSMPTAADCQLARHLDRARSWLGLPPAAAPACRAVGPGSSPSSMAACYTAPSPAPSNRPPASLP